METVSAAGVRVERDADVAIVTLNRPEKRNALSLAMMRELDAALAAIGQEREVRVVVLRGDGPAFCAGHDLRELVERDVAAYREIFDTCVGLMARMIATPQPVIAEVGEDGDRCRLSARRGLRPGGCVHPSDLRDARRAHRLVLQHADGCADARDRAQARDGDAADRRSDRRADGACVGAGKPRRRPGATPDETLALARKIAASSRTIVGIGKAAFYAQIDLDQTRAYEYTKAVMTSNACEPDATEGITAFLERRRTGVGGDARAPLKPDEPSPTPGMRGPTKRNRVYATAGGLAYGEPFCVLQKKSVFRANESAFVTLFTPRTRYAAIVLIVALLASLAVALFRLRAESHANRVELAMDYTDFDALARSYDYNPAAFLIALRRAGLTSLALTEELGANVGDDGKAYATTGAALVNQARIAPIRDPLLAAAGSHASHRCRERVYLLVSDPSTYHRYRSQLALHFMPRACACCERRGRG